MSEPQEAAPLQWQRSVTIAVACTHDLAHVRQILSTILAAEPRVLATPAPGVAVAELSRNSMQLAMRAWSKTADYAAVRGAVLEHIKLAFDQQGIAML